MTDFERKLTAFETWWEVEGYPYYRGVCATMLIFNPSDDLAKTVAWKAWIASKEHSAEVTVNQLTEVA